MGVMLSFEWVADGGPFQKVVRLAHHLLIDGFLAPFVVRPRFVEQLNLALNVESYLTQ
jgi:hypothetical protein